MRNNKRSTNAVEYWLIAALIAVSAIGATAGVWSTQRKPQSCPLVEPDENGVISVPAEGCVTIPTSNTDLPMDSDGATGAEGGQPSNLS